ncbi:hypothetical protein F5I97DRAFT_1158171 [Phlebopus sp. FC_14]|nr:hypothetical protein F5I97DRAFT_1158171 [Phlebopus sp. FC_14]
MFRLPLHSAVLAILYTVAGVSADAQTWCGKYYNSSQVSPSGATAPSGNFPLPAASQDPLLAFRCAPAIRPYLAEDMSSPVAVLIDSPVVYYEINGAQPINLPSGSLTNAGTLSVTVSLDGKTLTNGTVPLNATAYELTFSLQDITPHMTAYNLSCQATYSAGSSSEQSFSTSAALSLLPNPTSGSVTKMDLRTGALLAKPASGTGGDYEPIFPIGFYTGLDYLSLNTSVIDELGQQGFTIINLVPGSDDEVPSDEVLDRMQEAGLYLMYDMRYIYMDASAVTEQVNTFKNRTNLLLWYTGDEPDGSSDPLNATTSAYDLIYNLDGYHPVSLVLNCQDYYWTYYTAGTDIVMQDVYMVGVNVTFSNTYQTPCTPEYGDCGCDNCLSIPAGDTDAVPLGTSLSGSVPANSGVGTFFDISSRIDSFQNRMMVMGWERTKAVWTVPQAFGEEGYWVRNVTGEEWLVQSIVGINHGALGVVPWVDPTTPDIKGNASSFALSLPKITPFLFNSASVRSNYVVNGVDVATWRTSNQTLVLAANTNYVTKSVNWSDVGVNGTGATMVFAGGTTTTSSGFSLGSVGSGAFVVTL